MVGSIVSVGIELSWAMRNANSAGLELNSGVVLN